MLAQNSSSTLLLSSLPQQDNTSTPNTSTSETSGDDDALSSDSNSNDERQVKDIVDGL